MATSTSQKDRVGRSTRKAELLPGVSDPELLAAYAAAQAWLRRSYVTALGIGYARTGGKPTREMALSVHVTKRVPDAELSPRQRFPRTLLGVRVDVVESNIQLTFLRLRSKLAGVRQPFPCGREFSSRRGRTT